MLNTAGTPERESLCLDEDLCQDEEFTVGLEVNI